LSKSNLRGSLIIWGNQLHNTLSSFHKSIFYITREVLRGFLKTSLRPTFFATTTLPSYQAEHANLLGVFAVGGMVEVLGGPEAEGVAISLVFGLGNPVILQYNWQIGCGLRLSALFSRFFYYIPRVFPVGHGI
jgi:hypothetical protein